METRAVAAAPPRRTLRAGIAGTLAFAAIFAAGVNWAKWTPYLHKLQGIIRTRTWPGGDLLAKAGAAHSAPSFHAAWTFTTAYANDVWPGFLAALLAAAALEALVPRRWLLRTLAHRTDVRSAFAGGVLALPSLMCTCCTAPLAVTLRRNGAPTSSVLAYWFGNPVLNPAVLAFLALVAPWQWVVTRIAAGLVLVFGVSVVVARLAGGGERKPLDLGAVPDHRLQDAPLRFLRALARLAVTLIPAYALVVFGFALFRGWLFPLDGSAVHWGTLAIVAAALLGALVVIPTGGEIPIVQGLALAGASAGVLGALLIALPAISLVSMAMVVRELSPRVTVAAAAGVVGTSVLAGVLLAALA
ncbi:MAG TPA: permease [Gaiellaceae bacterium]|nr:permease [Gaiellaceae bacterium]